MASRLLSRSSLGGSSALGRSFIDTTGNEDHGLVWFFGSPAGQDPRERALPHSTGLESAFDGPLHSEMDAAQIEGNTMIPGGTTSTGVVVQIPLGKLYSISNFAISNGTCYFYPYSTY